jgi:hypothetical protein
MRRNLKSKLLKGALGLAGFTYLGLYATGKLEDAKIYAGGISRAGRCVGYGTQIVANYLLVSIYFNE